MTAKAWLGVLRLRLERLRVLVREVDLRTGERLVEVITHQLIFPPLTDRLCAPKIQPSVKRLARPSHLDGRALDDARSVHARQSNALAEPFGFARADEMRLELRGQCQRACSCDGGLGDRRTRDIGAKIDEVARD